VAYLMGAVNHQFPSRSITLDDVIATWAGVRPVIGTGKDDPSKESRDYVIWQEAGLLTVTGGKLTTFRAIAQNALKAASDLLPNMPTMSRKTPVLNPVEVDLPIELDEPIRRRLLGRYARNAPMLVSIALPDELAIIPNTHTLWAELRWCARAEGVIHLEDLMLRRTRIGLLLPNGGADYLPRIRAICQKELGWDDATWEAEVTAYITLWNAHYSLPPRDIIPNWDAMLKNRPQGDGDAVATEKRRKMPKWVWVAVAIVVWRIARNRRASDTV
jgi:glycerol-3-phosphate dehydrogenase